MDRNYGIALPKKSHLRDRMNIALLQLIETGEFEEVNQKWFGP
jgi:ABC-type amino acid transport substrate-binding protein